MTLNPLPGFVQTSKAHTFQKGEPDHKISVGNLGAKAWSNSSRWTEFGNANSAPRDVPNESRYWKGRMLWVVHVPV